MAENSTENTNLTLNGKFLLKSIFVPMLYKLILNFTFRRERIVKQISSERG